MLNFLKTKNQNPDQLKRYLVSTGSLDEESYEYYQSSFPELKKQKIGEELQDVICDGRVTSPWLSTNIDAYIGMLDQMNWGYRGTGPRTLALNILYLFTGEDKEFAEKYFNDFVEEFLLSKKQTESLIIKKEKIIQWISFKREGKLTLINGGTFVQ